MYDSSAIEGNAWSKEALQEAMAGKAMVVVRAVTVQAVVAKAEVSAALCVLQYSTSRHNKSEDETTTAQSKKDTDYAADHPEGGQGSDVSLESPYTIFNNPNDFVSVQQTSSSTPPTADSDGSGGKKSIIVRCLLCIPSISANTTCSISTQSDRNSAENRT